MDKVTMLTQYMNAAQRLLLLDYDGTLVPFASRPEDAVPDQQLYDILQDLAKDPANTIYIISGRDKASLDEWLGNMPLNIVSEHGAQIKQIGGSWKMMAEADAHWKEAVMPLLDTATQDCEGSFIEHKKFSLAWHYRNAEPVSARKQALQLMDIMRDWAEKAHLDLLDGNKVMEIRVAGINKGAAVKQILEHHHADFILAAGDDTTDEDMFLQLRDTPGAYTIKLGDQPSFAHYHLHTTYMIRSLLQVLVGIKK